MPKRKNKRALKRTLLIVGEGEAEKAFLQHLKSIYGQGDPKISIKSAGGKGPKNVIISTKEASGFDYACALLDTDIVWPATWVKQANSKKIVLVGSTPCLEGLLLDILSEKHPTPSNNETCKKKVHPMLSGKETCKLSYVELFDKALLDSSMQNVDELKELIDLITGKSL